MDNTPFENILSSCLKNKDRTSNLQMLAYIRDNATTLNIDEIKRYLSQDNFSLSNKTTQLINKFQSIDYKFLNKSLCNNLQKIQHYFEQWDPFYDESELCINVGINLLDIIDRSINKNDILRRLNNMIPITSVSDSRSLTSIHNIFLAGYYIFNGLQISTEGELSTRTYNLLKLLLCTIFNMKEQFYRLFEREYDECIGQQIRTLMPIKWNVNFRNFSIGNT